MAAREAEPAWPARERLALLNHDVPRVDGPVKVRGAARYTHDVRVPGMLWARILCSPHAVARPTIDLAPALALAGVEDAIALDGELDDGWVRRLGQPIAAVAARTPELAEDGVRAIAVRWELGDWAVDFEQATAEGAPAVDPKGNVRFQSTDGDREAAEAALAKADAVVEATYTVPVQHHVSLETHGVVVDYRGGDEATIYASTQGTFTIADEAAEILGVPQSKVTAIVQHMGGGFGSKFGLDIPGRIACMLAKRLGRPVHLMLTRPQEFVTAGNRSGNRAAMRGGATKDGKLAALVADVYRLGGVGRGSYPGGRPYIYAVRSFFLQMQSVLTNTDANRAMRAPGHPQASFGIESMVDELAHAIGMDPLEFRKRNLADPVYHRQLDRAAQEIGWASHPNRTGPPDPLPERAVGIGFGVSTWGTGAQPICQVEVRIEPDGSVTSSVGAQDLGTGTRTYVASIVAEILGLPVDAVEPRLGSTEYGACVGSGGSVTVPSLAPAVLDAAWKARAELFERVAPGLDAEPGELIAWGGEISSRANPEKRATWKEACAALGTGGIRAQGGFRKELADRGVHGAQAAQVEVDTLTGEVRVLKMVCVQDCGLPLNRLATRSQINGGMIQGMSYGLWEERVIDPWLGLVLNPSLEEYKVAGTMDVPELVAIIDDDDTRQAVCGIGEPPVIPGQSAVANAIFNACGVRLRDLPLSRDKVILGLEERRRGGGR